MRSNDLYAHGFGGWAPFTKASKAALIATLPKNPVVYAITCCREFTRRVGTSDILYFGEGTNQDGLKHRIGQYFSPDHRQETNLRLLALLGDSADYELAFVATPSASVVVGLEALLLELYEADHGELPPENKRRDSPWHSPFEKPCFHGHFRGLIYWGFRDSKSRRCAFHKE